MCELWGSGPAAVVLREQAVDDKIDLQEDIDVPILVLEDAGVGAPEVLNGLREPLRQPVQVAALHDGCEDGVTVASDGRPMRPEPQLLEGASSSW